MTKEDLKKIIINSLGKKILKVKGSILYSSLKTLDYNTELENRIYLLGTNPGGKVDISIEEHLNSLCTWNERGELYSAYLDEKWESKNLQNNLKRFFESFPNLNLRNITASNIIFNRTENTNKIKDSELNSLADEYWSFHNHIIQSLKKKIIIAFGSGEIKSPYSYLKKKMDYVETIDNIKLNSKAYFKAISGKIGNQKVIVIGIPHFSRYNVADSKTIMNKINSIFE